MSATTTSTDVNTGWPAKPDKWPEVMTDVEVCQYLRLDLRHETPAKAKRSLYYIRQNRGLSHVGRTSNKLLFLKTTVDAWLKGQEQGAADTAVTAESEGLR